MKFTEKAVIRAVRQFLAQVPFDIENGTKFQSGRQDYHQRCQVAAHFVPIFFFNYSVNRHS